MHAVYVARDADGGLLYIGVTRSPLDRMRKHRRDSAWWELAESIRFWYFDPAEAARLERELIEKYQPPHNIQFTARATRWATPMTADFHAI